MNSTVRVVARRAAVTVGVVGSLGLGAATIDAAAHWTAAAAPMQAPSVSAESLASQLASEQVRGTDLESRLQAAISQTSQLQTALDTANARITTDGSTATALRAQIAAAETKLAALNKQAAAAAAALKAATIRHTVVTTTVRPTTTNATTGASGAPASGGGDD